MGRVVEQGPDVPGTLTVEPMTKDRKDVGFSLDLGVDYVALSFVRRASDVDALQLHGLAAASFPSLPNRKTQAVDAIDKL